MTQGGNRFCMNAPSIDVPGEQRLEIPGGGILYDASRLRKAQAEWFDRDYWQRREVELAELAKQMAEDAVARNAEVVTGYMNSQERRMIHVTLKEDARVRTFSLGDGMLKRVAVAPADFPERTEDDSAS